MEDPKLRQETLHELMEDLLIDETIMQDEIELTYDDEEDL